MENFSRHSSRSSHSKSAPKQRRNGYEPSDADTDWQDSPWHEIPSVNNNSSHLRNVRVLVQDRPKALRRSLTPPSRSSNHDYDFSSPVTTLKPSLSRKNQHKSPYRPQPDDDADVVTLQTSTSPFMRNDLPKHIVYPYKTKGDEAEMNVEELRKSSSRTQNHKASRQRLNSEENRRPTYNRRSVSAPKPRAKEKEQPADTGLKAWKEDRTPSPLPRKHRETASEINEMIATARTFNDPANVDSKVTESISPGDIFFSQTLPLQRNVVKKNPGQGSTLNSKPKEVSKRDSVPRQRSKPNANTDQTTRGASSNTVTSQKNTTLNRVSSRRSSSKRSTQSSKMSDGSGTLSESFRKFTDNMQISQKNTWFSCGRKGPCRTSKAPESHEFDEASFIQKAFVVENLRHFWADKHQPGSLSGFICNKQQAQHLKQLISHNTCPHILFKGPSGSGKKALARALLCEIYGDQALNITHELRCFSVQEKGPMQIVVPLISSPHHVELYLKSETTNVRFALMTLVKEMTSSHAMTPEVSNATCWADYKVIVFYEVEKLAENVQHMIKWIMDCYMETCKIILCCEDDVGILDSVKSRCKIVTVDAPITHEIMEVLIQIGRKESFDLPMSFAAKIATKSKQNIRKAVMALEACKAHNYPFADEQPIPIGWEDVLVELSADILSDPSPQRSFFIRVDLQKLLGEFVHPRLILQKLVEQFLKRVDASVKRELYYWHAYYDKRLPEGTTALLKLEEFVAKFMSIYRKSLRGRLSYLPQ
ncbi:hypothetical protein MKW98_031808 [Papaver atlanticum]|uniref:Replication factor C subunit 3 n=1 Tax=Papaver atlanticum TaxID=357466 RepID=A0AAD4SEL4_9MAGN|nr:hypothetical protein MKW98_031808 [Papaver atlanticum]